MIMYIIWCMDKNEKKHLDMDFIISCGILYLHISVLCKRRYLVDSI